MSRAAVTYKTKNELAALSADELDKYISWLKQRASILGGLPSKEVEKKIAVAQKVRGRFPSHESD